MKCFKAHPEDGIYHWLKYNNQERWALYWLENKDKYGGFNHPRIQESERIDKTEKSGEM